MLKSKISITLGTAFVVVAMGALVEKAWADGSFSLSGNVPTVNTAAVLWANPNVGLGAQAHGAVNVESVIAALQVYSNDPLGFIIKVGSASATAGTLVGGTTHVTVPYQVALFSSLANAAAGTTFLAAPGGAGAANSQYTTPGTTAVPLSILTSGALTSVVDTSIGVAPNQPYFLGMQTLAANVSNLMADTYTDTLTFTMIEE